jgi:predicted RNA binding protein YcfA (HicA-like mRNA interferase family)
MILWPSCKSRQVLAALLRIGWPIKREAKGSQRVLHRPGWADYVFAFHDGEEIGPRAKPNREYHRIEAGRPLRILFKPPDYRTIREGVQFPVEAAWRFQL